MTQSKAGWLCPECGHLETHSEADKAAVSANMPVVLGHDAVHPNQDDIKEDKSEVKTEPQLHEASDVKTNGVDTKTEVPDVAAADVSIAVDASPDAPPSPVVVDIPPEDSPEKVLADSIAEIEDTEQPEKIADKSGPDPTESPKLEPQTALSSSSAVMAEGKGVPSTSAEQNVAPPPEVRVDSEPEVEPDSKLDREKDPQPGAEPDLDPEPKSTEKPAENELDPGSKPTDDEAASAAPDADTAPEAPVAAVTPAKPVQPSLDTPIPVLPTPVPGEVPVGSPITSDSSVLPAPVGSPAPTAPDPKLPLQAVTHPPALTKGRLIGLSASVILLLALAGTAVYAAVAKPGDMSWLTGSKVTQSPQPAITTKPVLAAEVTPQPSPAVADSAIVNAQRKTILATYASAYKAMSTNGFFPVNPPAVAVNAGDPTTNQLFIVSKNKPTAIGQIYYWIGGSCSGAIKIPGLSGSRSLALQTLLEGTSVPYCIDVK